MTISPELLIVGQQYSRSDLAELFDEQDLATSREGLYARDLYDYVPFFVTLDKQEEDPSLAYNDYFEDGLFFWESQNKNTLESKWIAKIAAEDLTPLLFVREIAKIKGKTQKFVYAGVLANPLPDLKSSKPVTFSFEPIDLSGTEPNPLRSLINWKPGGGRRKPLEKGFAEQVERKRKKGGAKAQGFEADPQVRRAIELRAMDVARQAYERNGYEVKDVSGNHPYDLLCSKPGTKKRRVEVKGTRGDPSVVNLTVGEVLAAREPNVITDLFVVFEIQVLVKKPDPLATGGKVLVTQGWVPNEADLEPTQYRYKVPVQTSKKRN